MNLRLTPAALMLLFASVLFFITCSDDNGPYISQYNDPGSLFSVTVVDTLGAPVEGIRVGRINHTSHVPLTEKSGEESRLIVWHLGIPFRGYMTMYVHDYYHQIMQVLSDSSYFSDIHVYPLWHAEDSTGEELRDGYYYCYMRIVSWTNPDSVFEGTYPTVLEPDPHPNLPSNIMGVTGSDGTFATDDTLYFPYLLGNPPRVRVNDGVGRLLDTLIFYSSNLTITLSDTANPTAFVLCSRVLTPASNQFFLVWDPKLAE